MTGRQRRTMMAVTLAGLIGSIVALLFDAHGTLAAWLAAAVAASAVPIGALAVLFLTYLMRREWTDEMHVPLAAAALTIPVAGLLFLPVLAGMSWLYPWVHTRPEHAFQKIYLAPWLFVLRNIAYFAIWSALAVWARRAWGDKTQMTRVASIGIIVYTLTVSLAAVDWIESLTPDFHSSIFGLLFTTFQLLAGLAFGIATVVLMRPRSRALAGYGALFFATLLLWAYMHAMQYIVIWSGNIPEEVEWYVHRLAGGWGFVLWGLIFLQFIVPFFAMLLAGVRRRRYPMLVMTVGTLALRFVESFLLILPAADAVAAILWLATPAALAATVGLLGLSLQFTLNFLERSAIDRRALPESA
jgi:hypothetical protein